MARLVYCYYKFSSRFLYRKSGVYIYMQGATTSLQFYCFYTREQLLISIYALFRLSFLVISYFFLVNFIITQSFWGSKALDIVILMLSVLSLILFCLVSLLSSSIISSVTLSFFFFSSSINLSPLYL